VNTTTYRLGWPMRRPTAGSSPRSIPTAMTATVALRERILAFVAYFNQTAKPFR
jgi:hypothetical protein